MNASKKPMPVGIENFKELIEKKYFFVDKTRFIKDLLDDRGKVTLITRPRRFGKTLNLSMLKFFFTLEEDEANRKLFAGLDIERAGDEYMEEQGKRPVIFFTLKGIQAADFPGMMSMLSLLLRRIYGQSEYLLESSALSESEKDFFSEVLRGKCTTEKMRFSLVSLMDYLCKHHQRPPVLLLDEYDAPILSAWENGYYDSCIGFFRGFLGEALKSNDALDFAVLTGVARISKESIFSGLNNLKISSVLSDRYSDIFGFTQGEVDGLMQECGLGDRLPELKKWYDGYHFGEQDMYNPWSVVNFIDNGCRFQPYWVNVSGNSILHVLLEQVDEDRRRDLEGLMQDRPIEATIDEGVIYPDIRRSSNSLYMMMLTTGYLKAVEACWDPTGEELPHCKLLIPNREIRIIYRKEILGWLATTSDSIHLQRMLQDMTAGKLKDFQERLRRILTGLVSCHDPARHPESFYHGLMLGFSVLMSGSYRVESNRESGHGRFDLAFFPLREKMPGVILELKAAKSEEQLEGSARAALQQIEEKEYDRELARQGVATVWKYGIAFCGKKVWMKGK